LIPLSGPGVNLIFGWAGVAQILCENGQVVDLSDETDRIGGVLSGEKLGEKYVKRFSEDLRRCFTDEFYSSISERGGVALFVGFVENIPKYWRWQPACENEPQEIGVDQGPYQVTSGREDLLRQMRLPDADTLVEGADGLCRYIDCCAANFKEYGGEPQIETVSRRVPSNSQPDT
jgi:hypothetical protein